MANSSKSPPQNNLNIPPDTATERVEIGYTEHKAANLPIDFHPALIRPTPGFAAIGANLLVIGKPC